MRIGTSQQRRWYVTAILILWVAASAGCSDGNDDTATQDGSGVECNSEPLIRTTVEGIQFVRTPDSCFRELPGFPYEAKYVEIDGLRQGYVDVGPADEDPILLLHGQPSWSYLYRKMIPVLVDAGHRVVAMDHVGMGRSDKPIEIEYYSYLGHVDRLEKFIRALNLDRITMFCQDWGGVTGLHAAGEHPEWFDRIVVGNATLPVIPGFIHLFPPFENPDEIDTELTAPFADIPPEQPPFYDEEGNPLIPTDPSAFGDWIEYSLKAASFHASEVVEALTYFDVPSEEEAAYDAPFPSRIYMAGPRVFAALVNELPGVTRDAWERLTRYKKPFLTIWGGNDPDILLGTKQVQDNLIKNIPGAEGQPHTRLSEASHFLQDDQGAEIARQMVEFIVAKCIDNDEDGYGTPATHDCEHPELDCDGGNPDVHPGMTEIRRNGIDDDCDPGTPAYPEPANTMAASYGSKSLTGSGVFNSLALLLIPIGWVIFLRKLPRD